MKTMNICMASIASIVSLLAASTAEAQQITNLPSGTEQSVGIEGGLESGFVARATYAHELPGFLRDGAVYGRFTWPVMTPDLSDFAIDAGASGTVLGSSSWKVQLLLGPVVRNTSNLEFDATALGLRSGLLAGYRSDTWGLMAEAGFERIFATHLRHSQLYREVVYADAKNGWYAITAGTLQLGVRGGGRIGRVEVSAALGIMTTDRLVPHPAPFYATLGAAYAF